MAAAVVDQREQAPSATVLIVENHVLLADGLAVSLRHEGIATEVVDGSTYEAIMEAASAANPTSSSSTSCSATPSACRSRSSRSSTTRERAS